MSARNEPSGLTIDGIAVPRSLEASGPKAVERYIVEQTGRRVDRAEQAACSERQALGWDLFAWENSRLTRDPAGPKRLRRPHGAPPLTDVESQARRLLLVMADGPDAELRRAARQALTTAEREDFWRVLDTMLAALSPYADHDALRPLFAASLHHRRAIRRRVSAKALEAKHQLEAKRELAPPKVTPALGMEVWRQREGGLTWKQVAAAHGVSISTAQRALALYFNGRRAR